MTAPRWTPKSEWVDIPGGEYRHVREVWSVAGPAPFGGLACVDEDHAAAVCETLNYWRDSKLDRLRFSLGRALVMHMFGERPSVRADRVAALYYLRSHGLPEATAADLDAACEGLETPWGSGPRATS